MIEQIDNYYFLSLAFTNAGIKDPEHVLNQLRSINTLAEVQLVKADLIAGPEHLQFAARNAVNSFNGDKRRSKTLAVELLLYLSCQRQIAKAIRFMGVDSKDSRIVLIALSRLKDAIEELARHAESIINGKQDDSQIEIGSKEKMAILQQSYGVTREEMEAARFEGETKSSTLKRLIVERSALLDLGN